MAVEASSMAWRATWRLDSAARMKQQKAVGRREAKRLQAMLGVPPTEQLLHVTSAAFDTSMRVHGQLLVYSEALAFYAKVFGMVVKKLLPVSPIVAVLRDTPSTQTHTSAIEVSRMPALFRFCAERKFLPCIIFSRVAVH